MEYYDFGGSTHIAFIKNIERIKIRTKSINDMEIDLGLVDKSGPFRFIYKVRIPFNIAIEITMLNGILWFYIKTSIKLDINR
jgi:hypothetical protein